VVEGEVVAAPAEVVVESQTTDTLEESLYAMLDQVDEVTAAKARESLEKGADARKVLARLTEIALSGGAK
jgi:hypothetical protein